MAKKFNIKAVNLINLTNVIAVEPKELFSMLGDDNASPIGIRKFDKLKDELLEANVAYTDAVAALAKAVKPLQEEFRDKSKDADEAGKAEIIAELNAKMEALPESAKAKEESEREVEVKIGSNERFDMLKSLASHKSSLEKWRDTKACLAVDDALNAATDWEA